MDAIVVGKSRAEVTTACSMAAARGASVRRFEALGEALTALLGGASTDLLLVDVAFDIEELTRRLHEQHIAVPIIAYGIDTDARTAVRAVRAGATEFLPLPPDEDLIAAIFCSMMGEQASFVFEDPATKRVLAVAKQIAPSDASVLITGESGTGKEMVSRYIHQHSRRHAKRLISVNCAAIPDNLLESELFGHEKGAFTGATTRRIGKFEEADGGTLLLDEISEMEPRLQAKLLRALQEREIDRVGGSRPVKVDIRLIATSNRDLPAEVSAGSFREDLYFRLNVVQLELPPLRERLADLPPLSRLFIERYSKANNVPVKALHDEALGRLRNHSWPGNVRELENCMHRAVLLSRGDMIGPEAIVLPDVGTASPTFEGATGDRPSVLVGKSVAEVEKRLIVETLAHTLGNRTRAATILGISIRTLRNKLKQYSDEGVPIPQPGAAGSDQIADWR
jgi:DNA-binding NtrC family response regulator